MKKSAPHGASMKYKFADDDKLYFVSFASITAHRNRFVTKL